MPVFIHRFDHGLGGIDVGYYGLPQIDVPGVKVAAHHTGPELQDPDHRDDDIDENRILREKRRQQSLEAASAFVAKALPHLNPQPTSTLTCLYTVTPDHDFVLDAHPFLPQVYIAAGFSGHGFKFAPAIGHIMACLALGKDPGLPIHRFRLDRFTTAASKIGENPYR